MQVNQRHGGVTQQPDGCARYHQQEQGSVDLPQRDSLGSVSDQADHATDMQYHHHHSGRHPDPLLQVKPSPSYPSGDLASATPSGWGEGGGAQGGKA